MEGPLPVLPLILFFFFCKFYFIFKLYIIVLVLPNIKMNDAVSAFDSTRGLKSQQRVRHD